MRLYHHLHKLLIIGIIDVITCTSVSAQLNFNQGVNLTNWFQAGSVRQIQFTKFTKQDFIHIKSLGCDVVRLPINLHYMTSGNPDYIIDPLFFSFLDSAVNWAEDLKLNLILDNHTFDPAVDTQPDIGNVLVKVWKQMAAHYKDRSNYILYEILNEPHGLTTQSWGQIQQSVIDAIRQLDTKHTIVVGASGYNAYSELNNLPVYADTNLLYTFHFYDPFMFTHQGASWTSPSMELLSGVPFPYNAGNMPACPVALKGSWVESSLNSYISDGTEAKVKSLIDIAVNFQTNRKVKIFCGEFGAYIPNSPPNDRVYWYEVMRKYLNEKGIPWTIWDYTGGFGLFTKGSNEIFDYDLNVPLLQSLGLTVPPQQSFVLKADSVGFPVYRDYIEQNILESSGTSGTLDFYNTIHPEDAKFCIYWTGSEQYNQIGFDFKPDKDLSQLLHEHYALDFFARGTASDTKIDLRFIDTKTNDPNDHPWRINYTVDENLVSWDRYWHHVHIPLQNFTEMGSWDNAWYTPEGKFDWKAVDRFEIVSEHSDLIGKELWFDNIGITDQDTAQVRDTTFYDSAKAFKQEDAQLKLFPNPISENTVITFNLPLHSDEEITLYSLTGQKLCSQRILNPDGGFQIIPWNKLKFEVPEGVYFLQLSAIKSKSTIKIVKLTN